MPYKRYVALISQQGTGDPTVVLIKNTIGPIVWTRFETGGYYGSLPTDKFPLDKTFCMIRSFNGNFSRINPIIDEDGINRMLIVTYEANFNIGGYDRVDGVLNRHDIEIRVYP